MGNHYRPRINSRWEALAAAEKGLARLRSSYLEPAEAGRAKDRPALVAEFRKRFRKGMNDDLGTPAALAVLHELLASGLPAPAKRLLADEFDAVLGLGLSKFRPKAAVMPAKIKELAQKREKFRNNKQFVQADRLREEADRLGYIIEDTPEGPRVRRKSID